MEGHEYEVNRKFVIRRQFDYGGRKQMVSPSSLLLKLKSKILAGTVCHFIMYRRRSI